MENVILREVYLMFCPDFDSGPAHAYDVMEAAAEEAWCDHPYDEITEEMWKNAQNEAELALIALAEIGQLLVTYPYPGARVIRRAMVAQNPAANWL